ncbi:MAG: hypothetical protein ACT6FE_00875 [Methanosarcinaceae archaeon]
MNNKENQIARSEIEKTITDLQKYLQDKVQETDARIYSEKHTASESYLSDMNGYSRGISNATNWAVAYLEKRLLDE